MNLVHDSSDTAHRPAPHGGRRRAPLRHPRRRSRRSPRSRSRSRRAARSAISSVPLAFELARRLRKAPRAIAQEIVGRPRTARRLHAHRGGAERLRQFLPRPAGADRRLARSAGRRRPRPLTAEQDHRRAHGHQPEQGRAHRAPAQRRARRRVRPAAALPRPPVEIQNYIDDTGVQVADVAVGFRELEHIGARRGPGARRRRRGSTTTAGTSTPRSPSGTKRTRRG